MTDLELLRQLIVLLDRRAMILQPVRHCRVVWLAARHAQREGQDLRVVGGRRVVVARQKQTGGDQAGPFVAVHKGMILYQRFHQRGGLGPQIG